MIKIDRPATVPSVLSTKGKTETDELCRKYDTGEREFDFDSGIYGSTEVKNALIVAQHGKCCFCEAKIRHVYHGDVEHFRPKAGYQDSKAARLQKPGYYWLVYEWTNLLFACAICNQKGKKNVFPLVDSTSRAKSHLTNIGSERSILIDPVTEDPSRFISFNAEVAVGIDDENRGKMNIEILDLNRPETVEVRFRRYKLLKRLFQAAIVLKEKKTNEDLVNAIQSELIEGCLDSAEFAGMVRVAIENSFGDAAH